jgi:hypothetical protein
MKPDASAQVIIDNMMNLEVLYKAADLFGGLDNYYDIAASHADTTAINHLRPDGELLLHSR